MEFDFGFLILVRIQDYTTLECTGDSPPGARKLLYTVPNLDQPPAHGLHPTITIFAYILCQKIKIIAYNL